MNSESLLSKYDPFAYPDGWYHQGPLGPGGWHIAINEHDFGLAGEITTKASAEMDGTLRFYLSDFYSFVEPAGTTFGIPGTPATIDNAKILQLHQHALAKEFAVKGQSALISVQWFSPPNSASAALIGQLDAGLNLAWSAKSPATIVLCGNNVVSVSSLSSSP